MIMTKEWKTVVEPLLKKYNIKEKLEKLTPDKNKILPKKEDIFKVFTKNVDEYTVVLLGQDPYPTVGHANGLAFSYTGDKSIPVSLRHIFKELEWEYPDDDLAKGASEEYRNFLNGDLTMWHNQGVMLLNTALTVEEGNAGSHLKAWQPFTEDLISYISDNSDYLVFILLGKKAQKYKEYINTKKHTVLEAPHPASESYSGGKSGFYKSDIFRKANAMLLSKNLNPIFWK